MPPKEKKAAAPGSPPPAAVPDVTSAALSAVKTKAPGAKSAAAAAGGAPATTASPQPPLGIPKPRSVAHVDPAILSTSAAAVPAGSAGSADAATFSSSGRGGLDVISWLATKQADKVATGGAVAWLKAQGSAGGKGTQPPAAAARPQQQGTAAGPAFSLPQPKSAIAAAAAAAGGSKTGGGVDLAAWARSAGMPLAVAGTAGAAADVPVGASHLVVEKRDRKSRQPKATASAAAAAAAGQAPRSPIPTTQPTTPPPPPALDESNPQVQAWLTYQANASQVRSRLVTALAGQESAAVAAAAGLAIQRIDVKTILDTIDSHDVTIISTDTGSGKSTIVPSALLDMSRSHRVVATQPRRTATISIASHVAAQRGQAVGEEVGYWIRGEKRGNDRNTRLWYMTSYTLLLQLLGTPLAPPFTHIVLDEFHERQPDIEVTVALLKLCLLNRTKPFKLIIMSATLDVADWQEYFKGLSVAVYRQSAPEHPIHDFFLEDVCSLVGFQANPPPSFVPPVVDQSQIESAIFLTQHLILNIHRQFTMPHHSILVFLPGRAQVEDFVMWTQHNLARTAEPIAWHSAVDLSTIQEAINRPAGHNQRQKIYFATDIAEVSITLPDVVFVIDTGLVKRPNVVPYEPASILYPPLSTQYISQGSVAQRRGRVGRTQQGFYFCLMSAAMVPMLPRLPPAPIQHSRIDELALHTLQLAPNPVAVFSLCNAQPLLQSITTSMRSLCEYGCIINAKDPLAGGEGVELRMTKVVAPSPDKHNDGAAAAAGGDDDDDDDDEVVVSSWGPMILRAARSLFLEGAGTGDDAAAVNIDEYKCTVIGRLLQIIPVSMQQGLLVFLGFLTGLESLMMLAAAAANSLQPFAAVQARYQGPGATGGRGGRANAMAAARGSAENMARAIELTEDAMRNSCSGNGSDLIAVMNAALRFRIQRSHPGATLSSLQAWCVANHLSYEKLLAIVELDEHIKYELSGFLPFRDLDDPQLLLQQLIEYSTVVVSLTSVAFASQAQRVTTTGGGGGRGAGGRPHQETATGLFTELKSMPDLHSPSSFRWGLDDIVVPISVTLRYSHTLVSYSTLVRSAKQFFLSLVLFAYRVEYDVFADDAGCYYEFAVTFHGKARYVETDQQTGAAILDFRQRLNLICHTLRIRYETKSVATESTPNHVPLDVQQREVMIALCHYFFAPASSDTTSVTEVEHSSEDEPGLTRTSLLSFK